MALEKKHGSSRYVGTGANSAAKKHNSTNMNTKESVANNKIGLPLNSVVFVMIKTVTFFGFASLSPSFLERMSNSL